MLITSHPQMGVKKVYLITSVRLYPQLKTIHFVRVSNKFWGAILSPISYYWTTGDGLCSTSSSTGFLLCIATWNLKYPVNREILIPICDIWNITRISPLYIVISQCVVFTIPYILEYVRICSQGEKKRNSAWLNPIRFDSFVYL